MRRAFMCAAAVALLGVSAAAEAAPIFYNLTLTSNNPFGNVSSGSGSFSVEGSTFQGSGNEFFQYSGSSDILLSLAFNIDGRTFDKADSLGGDRVFFQNGVFGGITYMGIDGGNVSISLNAGALSYTYSNTTVGTNLRFSQGTVTATRAAAPAVPEPASWAMMITGFGAIGTAMRRRKIAMSFA